MAKQQAQPNIIVNQINVQPAQLRSLDIQKFRNAQKSAESTSKNRKDLYDMYKDALTDSVLSSIIQKRILSILNLDLRLINDKNEENIEFSKAVEKTFFENLLKFIIESKFWGYSLVELDWNIKTTGYENRSVLVPRQHVKSEFGLVVKNTSDTTGVNYFDELYKLTTLKAGDVNDLGILLSAVPWVIYKRKGFSDFAEFAEVFGMPTRIGEYDTEEMKQALTDAFRSMGAAGSMALPKGSNIKSESFNASGNTTIHETFRNACNEEMTIAILAQSMTTIEASSGGYAQSLTQSEQQAIIHKADRQFVLRVLNEQLIPILVSQGIAKENDYFSFIDAMNVDLTAKINIDVQLSNIIPINDDYFYETYKIPKPADYEKLKKEMQEKKAAQTFFSDFKQKAIETDPQYETYLSEEKKESIFKKMYDFFFSIQ